MKLLDFLHGELLCVVPVLWFIGKIIKDHKGIKNYMIPYILTAISILLCGIYLFAVSDIGEVKSVLLCVFMSLTQGIIAAACAVFGNELFKQGSRLFEKNCNESKDKNKPEE